MVGTMRCGRQRHQTWPAFLVGLLAVALLTATPFRASAVGPRGEAPQREVTVAPPARSGYFFLRKVGAWRTLPGGTRCRSRVHHSTWEPRPDNAGPNGTKPNTTKVHASLAARPLSTDGSYRRKWDTWLLPRVAGNYTGTTDEIFQWAACKWGLSDNLLRAIAVRESTWYQYEIYPSGRCVIDWGCGDMVDKATSATRAYCAGISRAGHDYQADFGSGICPETFSIAGVMSWQDPDWGRLKGNQNGTFPFNRNSTAFALDYLGANLRGCYEGWVSWLYDEPGPAAYRPGDLWGCVGFWYSGEWRTQASLGYQGRVRKELRNRTWLEADWPDIHPACSQAYGCPRGS
jgi:hypothetical protein